MSNIPTELTTADVAGLAPVQSPPTAHRAGRGPLSAELLIEHVAELVMLQRRLLAEARWPRREERERGERTFALDSNGDAIQVLYNVPVGLTFSLTRVVVALEGFTAASPYTNANAWLGLFAGRPDTAGRGRLIDFAPTVAGAQLFPAVAEYNSADSGPLLRSGEQLHILVESGSASRMCSVLFQGVLREQ